MNFKPGELSKEAADALNRLARQVAQLQGITATPPLTINKSGYNPVLALSEQYQPLLAEVTVRSGSTYTVKRRTRNSANSVVDMNPGIIIPNVITPDGSILLVGDEVNIQPIPDWPLPEQWWWAYKTASGQGATSTCASCAPLLDMPISTCVKIRIRGGHGRCGCIEEESYATSGSGMYLAAVGGWISTKMKSTCCGCGVAIFRITDPTGFDAEVELKDFHLSCQGSSGGSSPGLFSQTLKLDKCCRSDETGMPMFVFIPTATADACNDDQEPCDNTFTVTVECDTCPDPICDCCCEVDAAQAWYWDNPLGNEYTDPCMNGSWVLSHDTVLGGCNWSATCTKCNGETITATLSYSAGGSEYVLDFNGSIFTLALADWSCTGPNTMTKISGDGPATQGVIGVVKHDPSNLCLLPDDLSVSLSSAACAIFNTTQTVHRISANQWTWTNPTMTGSRVTGISVSCVHGKWVVGADAECDRTDPDPPLAFSMGTTALPDSQSYGPLNVRWTGVPISGSAGAESCCVTTSDGVVVITE